MKTMRQTREQGWLQRIIEDADKRVNDWPDWKKNLVDKHGSSCKSQDSGEEPGHSDESEDES